MVKNNKELEELILDNGYEGVVYFSDDEFAPAVIGITSDERLVYDFEKMVEQLASAYGMDELQAIEYIEYNTIRSLAYVAGSPVIMYKFLE